MERWPGVSSRGFCNEISLISCFWSGGGGFIEGRPGVGSRTFFFYSKEFRYLEKEEAHFSKNKIFLLSWKSKEILENRFWLRSKYSNGIFQ